MRNVADERNGIERLIGCDEQLITLTEATRRLPKVDGKKISVCTLWRWCRRGLRGVSLEYVRVGRKICTTREALLRFFTDLAETDDPEPPGKNASAQGDQQDRLCPGCSHLAPERDGKQKQQHQ